MKNTFLIFALIVGILKSEQIDTQNSQVSITNTNIVVNDGRRPGIGIGQFNTGMNSQGIKFSKGICIAGDDCFPGQSMVIQKNKGNIHFSQLKVGDFIQTKDPGCDECQPIYTQVLGWLHRDTQVLGQYLQISQRSGNSFFSSAFHNIALSSGQYILAKDLLGHNLFGSSQTISKLFITKRIGQYAPMTESGNYYVLKKSQGKLLAHCFARISNPTFYEPVVKVLFKLWGPSEDKIHPSAVWMMKVFNFLVLDK